MRRQRGGTVAMTAGFPADRGGFDVVIAGGGSAGAVLATRLSEDPATRVLLLEAGPDISEGAVPAVVASAYPGRVQFNPAWFWTDLRACLGQPRSNHPALPRGYEQPKVLGGGSTVNGMIANRGQPADFDEWEAEGARGWRWDDVLPYFRKLERDLSHGGPLHGQDGPLPIRRVAREDWSGFTGAIAASAQAEGLPPADDLNGAWQVGSYPSAVNIDEAGRRASTALCYLTDAVRRRPNLAIATDAMVQRILFDGRRASGLRVAAGGLVHEVAARHVVVAAGALGSPVLLMRSGIGPAAHLAERGIEVRADRPGVGENLLEHPAVALSAFLPPGARLPSGERYHLQSLLRWSSGLPGAPEGDMHVMVAARSGWHRVGQRIGTLFGSVHKSYSRGRLRLGAAVDGPPEIDFRLLSDPRDLQRLMQSFRLSLRLLEAARARGAVHEIFYTRHSTDYSSRSKRLLGPTLTTGVMMAVAGPMMDAIPALRRRLLKVVTEDSPPPDILAADDRLLEDHLLRFAGGARHPCGTCRMGDPDAPMTVVDATGAVVGVDGLSVCDASIMPTIPCANLNVPVLMSAEKIADGLRRRLGGIGAGGVA